MDIKWHDGVETWTFPLTQAQLDVIGRAPREIGETVEVMAVAPKLAQCDPNLFLSFPQDEESLREVLYDDPEFSSSLKSEDGDEKDDHLKFLIRFGEMSKEEFGGLGEFDGW